MSFEITKVRVYADRSALLPVLHWEITLKNQTSYMQQPVFVKGAVYARDNTGSAHPSDRYFCSLDSISPGSSQVNAGSDTRLTFRGPLNHATLNRIEDLRKGNKLQCRIDLEITALQIPTITSAPNSSRMEHHHVQCTHEFEKSAWIEDVLDATGYDKVDYVPLRFADMRRDERLSEEYSLFQKAIKEYDEGEYNDVLGDCRKIVDAIRVRKDELRLNEQKSEKASFDHALKLADSYFSLGVHPESEVHARVVRRDAEFTLLTTWGILRYVLSMMASVAPASGS
jgi:hypothetical protein